MDISSASFKYKDMRGRKNVYTINEPRDLPTAASAPGVQEAHDDDFINPIGVYGWRKRCLYCLVLLLIVVVLVNLALTAWILVVLNFNIDGMGKLRVTSDGIRVEGVAEFLEPLITTNITSDENSRLVLQSHQNISVTTANSAIQLGSSDIQLTADRLNIETGSAAGSEQTPLLTATEEELIVHSSLLQAGGPQGVTFEGDVVTQEMRAQGEEQLIVEAPAGTLHLSGKTGSIVRSENGHIDIVATEQLTLSAQMVSLAGDVISIAGLQTRQPAGNGLEQEKDVLEVCVCPSGQLILVPADNGCMLPINACA